MPATSVTVYLQFDGFDARTHREIRGRRLADLEQRLYGSIFKSVPQRVATTLTTLATRIDTPAGKLRPGARHPQIALTHQQLAAPAGTSRETCTKVLREFTDRGLLRLARGRITVQTQRAPVAWGIRRSGLPGIVGARCLAGHLLGRCGGCFRAWESR
ncbi:helix-turn-helix domain-containing protein [Streptomyces sp. NPDC059866]|uniref:Crp/Fnr family transcriptional regulator n=1 Tax=Streptomyces sp. NPDC059866 TaxID=3346978 RepID=UPI003666A8D2